MVKCYCGCGNNLITSLKYIHGHNKPWLGKHRSEETKRKLSEINKNKIMSVETRNKISKFQKSFDNPQKFKKGLIPWNKGKVGVYSEETLGKMSKSHTGYINCNKGLTKETSESVMRQANIPRTESWKRKLSLSKIGDRNPMKREDVRIKQSLIRTGEDVFTGFKSTENKRIRNSIEYENWRNSVFERDNYTCRISKERGGQLVVHHIENFANNPELRFNINNGITMTKDIHIQFHNVYGYDNNTRQQFLQFFHDYLFKRR